MTRPKRHARGGFWNMERDRDKGATPAERKKSRERIAQAALRIMVREDLDWLGLGESSDYLHELAALPGARLVAFHGNGQGETALLVRDRAAISRVAIARMTLAGWFTVRGGKTPPKWLPSAVIDGLRVGVVHYAPSVNWPQGKPVGPALRVRSVLDQSGRLVRWLKRRNRPAIVVGDYNGTPGARGHASPAWVAQQAGAHIAAPRTPTKGHEVIDFGIARDCQADAETGIRAGSDHRYVTFDITY